MVTAATVTAKFPEAAPAGTVIDVGTETAALLLLKATDKPLLGAPALNLTVHDVVPAPVIAVVAHVSDCTSTCFRTLSEEACFTDSVASPPARSVRD